MLNQLDEKRADEINQYLNSKRRFEISGLGYYPNPLDPDEEKRKVYIVSHIKKVIDASAMLGINKINTFIGRDKNRSVDENFERFRTGLEASYPVCRMKKGIRLVSRTAR